jgi:glycosyltransferase involved in cell wall biosynthesis
MKTFFILFPSFNDDSPIKGAVALANELSKKHRVILVSLKDGKSSIKLNQNNNLEYLNLGKYSWIEKFIRYKNLITNDGFVKNNISISFCFTADIINSLLTKKALTVSSLRANIYENYKYSYGKIGFIYAKINFYALKKIKNIISMTKSMSNQVYSETGIRSPVVGNFLDEEGIEEYRRDYDNVGPYNFVFTGSITRRKRVDLLIHAIYELDKIGYDVICNIIGDGNLYKEIENKIKELNIKHLINLHGNITNPFFELSKGDIFVLPSESEGVSRSSMEALYLGIPCILRDIDGNSELIVDNFNGQLFKDESSLSEKMILLAQESRKNKFYKSVLLPNDFRQEFAVRKIEHIIEISN